MDLSKLLKKDDDLLIVDSFMKADSVINNPAYRHIMCSVSGGADSDIMLDICHSVDNEQKIRYVWFNTGLEYQATKEHLGYLEKHYHIQIARVNAIKPIPICCNEYGLPFLSKYVSGEIERLQRHHFKWEDEPYHVLAKRYPQCLSALRWWCNVYDNPAYSYPSMHSIGRNKWLKEFLIAHPPWFPISDKCCMYAKKLVAVHYYRENAIDLGITGVRKAEGGVRSSAYKNCFSPTSKHGPQYRPLFWFTNEIKARYEERFAICHSKCYTDYGMKRTGCAGCPFNRKIEENLNVLRAYEPVLYNAVHAVFGESYLYTRMYRSFAAERNARMARKHTAMLALSKTALLSA